jgi:hypothetical protein
MPIAVCNKEQLDNAVITDFIGNHQIPGTGKIDDFQ